MFAPTPSPNSAELALKAQGFNVSIISGLLVAKDIPFLDATRTVRSGVLAFPVELAGESLLGSGDHTAYFLGGAPHDHEGQKLDLAVSDNESFNIPDVGVAKFRFSRKKLDAVGTPVPYVDAREKLETYVRSISACVHYVDPNATVLTRGSSSMVSISGPFCYPDSASARVGIGHLNRVFEDEIIGIIGVGGTGSYILDLVAKTSVPEIHIFDGGRFQSHTAFRSPGAASIDDVSAGEFKVEHYARTYSVFRSGIVAHAHHVEAGNLGDLSNLTFAFVAVDTPQARAEILSLLEQLGIDHVDVGMGAQVVGASPTIVASVRTTFRHGRPNSLVAAECQKVVAEEDDYSSNIQIAELNAINAAYAVIRWKRGLGYYQDLVDEEISIFNTNVQALVNV